MNKDLLKIINKLSDRIDSIKQVCEKSASRRAKMKITIEVPEQGTYWVEVNYEDALYSHVRTELERDLRKSEKQFKGL